MRRNCNLELGLFLPYDSDHRHRHNHPMVQEGSQSESPMQNYLHHQQQEEPQKLTIFYDGKICVSDVTEFQANSILTLANKKMEERVMRRGIGLSSEPSSPIVMQSHHQQQLNSPAPGGGSSLSMKRSLQRFLQKRKSRLQEAAPYNHTR